MVIDFLNSLQAYIMKLELVGCQNQRTMLQHLSVALHMPIIGGWGFEQTLLFERILFSIFRNCPRNPFWDFRMKKWDIEKWGNLCMRTCLPCRGISYVPRSESIGFEFHPFIVEDLLKFVNDSTACDAFEAHEALPLPKCWSKMNKSYPYDVAEVPMRVLLMFPSTYLCEQGFVAVFCIKLN